MKYKKFFTKCVYILNLEMLFYVIYTTFRFCRLIWSVNDNGDDDDDDFVFIYHFTFVIFVIVQLNLHNDKAYKLLYILILLKKHGLIVSIMSLLSAHFSGVYKKDHLV